MYIVGLAQSHDASACLIQGDQVRVAIALERLMRIKRAVLPVRNGRPAARLPWASAIQYCLDAEGIQLSDVACFAAVSPDTQTDAEEAALVHAVMPGLERHRVAVQPHPAHHRAHALASFYTSGFTEAAGLVIDCYGSVMSGARESETGFVLRRGGGHDAVFQYTKPRRIAGQRREDGAFDVPDRLQGVGEIYRVVTLLLGFNQPGTAYDDAGKTMGLAPYGTPFDRAGGLLMRLTDDGIDCSPAMQFFTERNLLCEDASGRRFLAARGRRTPLSDFHMSLAAQVQLEFEDVCVGLARRLKERTQLDHLVLGGGSFLNSVANSRIAREAGFDEVYVFPAGTDDGTAVGAAFSALEQMGGVPALSAPPRRMRSAALGRCYADDEMRRSLDRYGVEYDELESAEAAADRAAALLAEGQIIGWFQGRSEFGPRALGKRSILANATLPEMKDILNRRVKFREPFRPFAPVVPEAAAAQYFDLERSSPFMLFVCDVRPEYRARLPAVTHVDGTARIQTVAADDDPLLHRLLCRFGEIAGIPVVLNTSFNVNTEPIVETAADAVRCFVSTDLDALVIGRFVTRRRDWARCRPRRRRVAVTVTYDLHPAAASSERILVRTDDHEEPHEISSRQLRLLQLVDGRRTVADLGAALATPAEQVAGELRTLGRLKLVSWS